MPKIPAVPGTLKRAYSQSRLPKSREAYGNDLLGFAADRWSRINKSADDLQALDDYAVQRRAYGGYNPEALNEMKMSILAARADAARDFDRTFGPRRAAWAERMRKRNERVNSLDDFQRAYNRQFIAFPPYRDQWARDRGALRQFVRPEYRERFDNVEPGNSEAIDELGDVYEYGLPDEMASLSYPGAERYLETGIPEEGILARKFVEEANEDMRQWFNANYRDPSDYPSKDFRDYESLNWDDYQYYR